MSRPRGGRHRDPAERRRRIFLTILLAFGLGAATTSLWALDPPLGETTPSSEAESTGLPGEAAPPALPDLALGEAVVQPQDAEAAPTSEAPPEEEQPEEPEPDEDEGGGAPTPAPDQDRTTEGALLAQVNAERSAAGCGPLQGDSRLDEAARFHAEDMAVNDYFSHTSLDGRSPTDRAAQQGYSGGVGENIAAGYRDAASVMEGWMNSEGHRANILNCGYDVIGIGIADRGGTLYWVQKFG